MTTIRTIAAALAVWFCGLASARSQSYAPPPPDAVPQTSTPGVVEPFIPRQVATPSRYDTVYTPDFEPVPIANRGWLFQIDPFIMIYGGSRFPALLTTGQPITDPASTVVPGIIGQPGTQVIRGNETIGGGGVLGLKLTVAHTFGDNERGSIDIGGFTTQSQTTRFAKASDSNGSPILARPYLDPVTGHETIDYYRAYPDYAAGSASDTFTTRLYGAEGNIRWDFLPITPTNRVGFTMLVGARYLQLNESFAMFDTSNDLPAGAGFSYQYADEFGTRNAFVGAQIGSTIKFRWQKAMFDVTGKLIGGNNHQTLNISGSTRITDPSGASATDHTVGLYAQPTNIGQWNRDVFSLGGELGLKFGWQFNDNFRLSFGYTFFGLGNVLRPGDQIDRTVNIQSFLGGPPVGVNRPLPTNRDSNFTTHTLNLGFEFMF